MKADTLVEDQRRTAQPRRTALKQKWAPSELKIVDPPKISGVLIGRLIGIAESGEPLVEFPGNVSPEPVMARSTLRLSSDAVGREVVLMFEQGDPHRPVVLGLIEDGRTKPEDPVELVLDKKRFIFTAHEEIVLRCGKSSITLTRAGKVLIRGAYLLNRSSGVNRIKGGSVQIN